MRSGLDRRQKGVDMHKWRSNKVGVQTNGYRHRVNGSISYQSVQPWHTRWPGFFIFSSFDFLVLSPLLQGSIYTSTHPSIYGFTSHLRRQKSIHSPLLLTNSRRDDQSKQWRRSGNSSFPHLLSTSIYLFYLGFVRSRRICKPSGLPCIP